MTDDDGVPTPEQLARIERGVLHRIDLRRRTARRVAGGAVAVLLVGGGIGLLASNPLVSSPNGSAGSAAGGSSQSRPEAQVTVRCGTTAGGDASPHTVRVSRSGLPDAAIDACAPAEFSTESGTSTSSTAHASTDGGSTVESPVLCVDVDGSYVVLSRHGSPTATCVRAGMEPYVP